MLRPSCVMVVKVFAKESGTMWRECVLTQEWTANMPILFMLAGYCGLGRPLREISRPLLLTNTYITLCWAAALTSSASLKWILILASLAMYALSSRLMFQWCLDFEKTAPKDLPGRSLRPLLSCGLILHFFLYGLVYLASAPGFCISCRSCPNQLFRTDIVT